MQDSFRDSSDSTSPVRAVRVLPPDQTAWRRPTGVSPGTWRYAHEGSIASRYNGFVADTPLCRLDLALLDQIFPLVSAAAVDSAKQVAAGATPLSRQSNAPVEGVQKKLSDTQKCLLDLGCGTGRAAQVLASRGYVVLAIDLSLPMLRQVRERNLDRVIAIQANLVELDALAKDTADGAVCLFSTLGMIQGRENRRQFLSHVRRIVRQGSPFYVHVHHRYAALTNLPGMRQLAVSAMRALTRRGWEFGDAVYPYRGLPDMFLHQFSCAELKADFAATGWQVQRWERLSVDGSKLLGPRERGVAGGFLTVVE